MEIDNFGKAVGTFLDVVARDPSRDPVRHPLTVEEFGRANWAAALAQVRLVNAVRQSMGKDQEPLSFWIGGSRPVGGGVRGTRRHPVPPCVAGTLRRRAVSRSVPGCVPGR